jgi:archaellum component FlaC
MDILEQIMEMQGQGISDEEIYQRLRNNGISPKEIYDATNQAKIKKAVSSDNGNGAPQMSPSVIERSQDINEEGFVPNAPAPNQQFAQDFPEQNPEDYIPQSPEQGYQDNYYTPSPQSYSEQGYYAPQGVIDMETISEIAEQIISERISELKKEIGDIPSFNTQIKEKVSDIDERLKRIENSIDKLQQAVIGKIGEFGDNSALIHKDLDNLHGTVSKLMNPLMDNYKELQKIADKK